MLYFYFLKNRELGLSFRESFFSILLSFNLLSGSNDLTQKMIHEPESVDIHNVMIAAQKAKIALNFTKAVRDEAIRAYRDFMNLR